MEHFYSLFTISWLLALLNIIIIDIVMSWDNAIIIWMATRNLDEKYRKKAIIIWIALATIMRIIFALFATFLLWVVWLKLAWWILLLYVVWNFYKELRIWSSHHDEWKSLEKATFSWAIYTIVLADVSMSLDNVLAVSWASHWNVITLWIWLLISIILMAFASNFIADKLEKYPQIQWIWLLVILFVAVEMILNWTSEVWKHFSISNLLPILIFVFCSLFVVLHTKYIKSNLEEKISNFMKNNYILFLSFNLILIILFLFFWEYISSYIKSHNAIFYTIIFLIVFVIMELVSILKFKKRNLKWE